MSPGRPTRIRLTGTILSAASSTPSAAHVIHPVVSAKRKRPSSDSSAQTKITLRLKPPGPPPTPSPAHGHVLPLSPRTVYQLRVDGLLLWHKLVDSVDCDGRSRSIHFMDLPSAADYPDYYQIIRRPIALNMIRARLESDGDPYPSLDVLLADFRLVFSNAKEYNLEHSLIYLDAKALLKVLKRELARLEGAQPPDASVDSAGHPKQKLKLKVRAPAPQSPPSPAPPPPQPAPPSPSLDVEPKHSAPELPPPPPSPPQPVVSVDSPASKGLRPTISESGPSVSPAPSSSVPTIKPASSSVNLPPNGSCVPNSNSEPLPPTSLPTHPGAPCLAAMPSNTSQAPHQQVAQAPKPIRGPVPGPSGSTLNSTPKDISSILREWIKTTIRSLEDLTDRSGRHIIEEFQTLPDKSIWASYYRVIPNPMAFDDIRARNTKREYRDVEAFAADVMLIFQNAQHFNEEGSLVWEDSKKLQAKFMEALTKTPAELTRLGPKQPPTSKPRSRQASPSKVPTVVEPQKQKRGETPPSHVSAVANPSLRRSPRSPSRPPSATNSSNGLLTRPASPRPKPRTPSPLAHLVEPSNLTNGSNLPSGPHSDISPALLSLVEQQNAVDTTNEDSALATEAEANKTLVAVKTVVGSTLFPTMIKRFKIGLTEPRRAESFRISNQHVSQHAFKLPRTTRKIMIDIQVNQSWPGNRILTRSSSSTGNSLVQIEQVKVRGMEVQMVKEKEKKKFEVDLVDGVNVVEIFVSGNNEGVHHHHVVNSTAGGENLVKEVYRLFIYR